jgi:hypothetical protein
MQTKEKNGSATAGSGAMRLVDKKAPLSRRGFIKGGGLASIGITVIGAATLLSNPTDVFAQGFTVLGTDAGKVLLVMARDIFPHDKIAEKYYLHAVEPYDAAAAKDEKLKRLLLDGIVLLNASAQKTYKKNYIDIALGTDRVVVLKKIEESPFFQKIRGGLVTGLYNNKAVFTQLGYEGSSWEKGGYVHRGFDDIDWV